MRQDIESAISTVMKEFKESLEHIKDRKSREKLVDGVIDDLVDKKEVEEAEEGIPVGTTTTPVDLQITRRST